MSVVFERDPAVFLDDHAPDLVRAYFREDDGVPWFTGAWFERISGPRPEPSRFTPADIAAVGLLSVDIPAGARREILHTRSNDLAALLDAIPQTATLWGKEAEQLIGPGSKAVALWQALDGIDGVGWVTAGKLCARKRPALLPVFDNVVRDALKPASGQFWLTLSQWLSEGPSRVARLESIKQEAGAPDEVTPLRILDIAIWMRQHGAAQAHPDDRGSLPGPIL